MPADTGKARFFASRLSGLRSSSRAFCLSKPSTGSTLGGFGFSLVFPAIGVDAVKRETENNRGTALGVYTAFSDVSFFLTGPIPGAIIGMYGYASVFLFVLVSVVAALGIVVVTRQVQGQGQGLGKKTSIHFLRQIK